MRRKKRFNVYTNATVKRCCCSNGFCVICKGFCKAYCKIDDEFIASNHPATGDFNAYCKIKTKLHHFGNGSLYPGKKFIFFDRKNKHSHYLKDRRTLERERSKCMKNDLQERLDDVYLIKELESLAIQSTIIKNSQKSQEL